MFNAVRHSVRAITSAFAITKLPIIFFAAALFVASGVLISGCSRPSVPSLTGNGMFHDIGQVRKGMSPNEVRRVMGAGYQNVMEEGIRGMDGGNYTWVYPEGKVYFGINGVTSVEAN